MSYPPELLTWTGEVSKHSPHLTRSQARVLAWYSFGVTELAPLQGVKLTTALSSLDLAQASDLTATGGTNQQFPTHFVSVADGGAATCTLP